MNEESSPACLGRDGYDHSGVRERHDIGMDDAEPELLDLGEHRHGHPLAAPALDSYHRALLREPRLDLWKRRFRWPRRRRRRRRRRGAILVGRHRDGDVARLLDGHSSFVAPTGVARGGGGLLFQGLEPLLELLHVLGRVGEDCCFVHLVTGISG